jgi:hypothetical protein
MQHFFLGRIFSFTSTTYLSIYWTNITVLLLAGTLRNLAQNTANGYTHV